MARYAPNFGDKLQIIAEMDKECGFPSNFNMPGPFTTRKTELPHKTELQPIRLPNGLLYPRVEVEQLTHSGDEILLWVVRVVQKDPKDNESEVESFFFWA